MTSDEALLGALQQAETVTPEERSVLLCFLAGRCVVPDAVELTAALRRSELLLAAGGDPRRPLELYGRAVTALADDLDDSTLRAQLATGLASLGPAAEGLPSTTTAVAQLRHDADLAWQCYAMALLAEALADPG
ncbi:MAG: hypothetical protein EXQ81_03205 [Thermoleophilia bacterium]|nr:hypothetical protein [Thermoleophilia bacterium]